MQILYFTPAPDTLVFGDMIEVDELQNITVEDRLRGAVWGQFVGDAAALGTHWIYDLDELQQLYPDGINGFEAPKEGHYHLGKKPGDQTHYGTAALVLLESLAKEGRFDPKSFGRSFVETFRPDIFGVYRSRHPRYAGEFSLDCCDPKKMEGQIEPRRSDIRGSRKDLNLHRSQILRDLRGSSVIFAG